jgi:hypothetical protein
MDFSLWRLRLSSPAAFIWGVLGFDCTFHTIFLDMTALTKCSFVESPGSTAKVASVGNDYAKVASVGNDYGAY